VATAIVLDLAVAAILLFFAIRGIRRGFVLTLASFVILIVAFVGAGFTAKAFSPTVAGWISPSLENVIMPAIDAPEEPSGISELTFFGVKIGETEAYASVSGAFENAVEAAAKSISESVAGSIAYCLVALGAFIILMVVLKLIARAIDLAFKLPVLSFFNKTLGLAAGIIMGVILIFAISAVLELFTGIIPAEAKEATYIYSFFSGLNPIKF